MSKKCFKYRLEYGVYKLLNEFETQCKAGIDVGVSEATIRNYMDSGKELYGCVYYSNELEPNKVLVPNKKEGANILIVDIETSPLMAYCWTLWNNNINKDQLISNFFVLCWSAKWLYDENIYSDRLIPEEITEQDDSRIMESLWLLLDGADLVIAHNGDKFDIPKINTRFIVHGMMPPSSYRTIDTLKIARNIFGFSSNRLDAINKQLGLPCKTETNMKLWVDCMQGDEEALIKMEEYNKNDVEILEQTYLKLRPYAKGHPNLGMYSDEEYTCPNCGSHELETEDKQFSTQSVTYQVYRCKECGALSRSKKGFKSVKKKLMAIPR